MATVMATAPSGRASVVDQIAAHEKMEVKRGGSILQENQHFAENRPCRDVIWALLFGILAVGVVFGSVYTIIMVFSFDNLDAGIEHHVFLKYHEATFINGLVAMAASGLAASFFSIAFLQFTKRNTECVVWTSIILGPCLLIFSGAYVMSQGWPMPGAVGALKVCIGVCLLACVICCYKDFIPLTVLLLRTVIHVVEVHPSMMVLCVVSGLIAAAWSLACFTCLLGSTIVDEEMASLVKSKVSASPMKALLIFLFVLVYIWGQLVSMNTAHTACAGVYGRWYFQKDAGAPVLNSLRVAWTTSFGSICYGSFIVALVRAVQAVVRALRKEAEEDGNIVLCIVLRIIECMIDCAGDIIEGITEWAYIQCAVRGVGFCDACWATFAVWVHSSVDAVVAALLIDLVPFLGALLVGALSAIVGFVVFHARVAMEGWSASVFCFCFFMGFGCSIAALMPLKSGSTTIIICYAEEKDFLRRKAPALYEGLCQAQLEYERDSSVASASSSRRGSHQNQQGQQARDVRAAPLMEMQAVQGQSQGR